MSNNIIQVKTNDFNKKVEIPSSKSYSNRLLILASLSKEEITIENISDSTDVLNLITCLKLVGVKISLEGSKVIVSNSFPECEKKCEDLTVLPAGDGGTTVRFLVPLLSKGSNRYRIDLTNRMGDRPFANMFEILEQHGCEVYKEKSSITINGPFAPEQDLSVDCSETTQVASGLALACSDNEAIKIKEVNVDTSKKYLNLTQALINQMRSGVVKYKVPIDYSSASYPICLAALTGRIEITNCFEVDYLQGDSILLNLAKKMGANVVISEDGIVVESQKNLTAIEHDCSDCLDLIPALSFLCSYAEGTSTLRNIRGIRLKESDRLNEIINLLNLFKVEHELKGDSLIIRGVAEKVEAMNYISPNDHRMAMTAYLFLRHNSGGTLRNFRCVSKSFPGFFELLN